MRGEINHEVLFGKVGTDLLFVGKPKHFWFICVRTIQIH